MDISYILFSLEYRDDLLISHNLIFQRIVISKIMIIRQLFHVKIYELLFREFCNNLKHIKLFSI